MSLLNRAYSLLDIKSLDAEQRVLTGIATTPSTDHIGDILESDGAQFKLPIPLLWQHNAKEPIGEVFAARVTPAGIEIQARLAKVDTPGRVRDRLDEAWQSLTSQPPLVRGFSVGFRPIKTERIAGTADGVRFIKWLWHELSVVTVPANAEATIHTIRSLDDQLRAASGTTEQASGSSSGASDFPPVTAHKGARVMKTIQEQISGFEAARQAKAAQRAELMNKAAEENVTLDAAQTEAYDGLDTEIKGIDAHLVRLQALEAENKLAAKAVVGHTREEASASRGGVITLKPDLPKGTGFTRYAMALAAGRGSRLEAAEYAKRWDSSTPEVAMILKAAVSAGTTTDSDWAAPLVVYQNLASEFVELLRPATIIGRIPGLRRVPFNVTMPTQTQGATANWVGQTKPKPVSELKFGQLSLGMAKAAGIVVLSEELVRSSNPSAEAIVRQDLINTIAAFLDIQFVDPSVAAVANVSPAAITNGITAVDSTGATAAAFRTDVKTLLATFTAANLSLSGSVWLMTETQAQALAMFLNPLGQPEFPLITMTGGTLFGLPVVTSEAIPAEGGSPSGNRIILVKANEIFFADDGGVTLDVSREASLQMNSTPDDPATASTVMVSLWQNNLVGLRAERFINWIRRRDAAVGIIEGAIYSG